MNVGLGSCVSLMLAQTWNDTGWLRWNLPPGSWVGWTCIHVATTEDCMEPEGCRHSVLFLGSASSVGSGYCTHPNCLHEVQRI